MKTTKHTPGPWVVGNVGEVVAGGITLADVYGDEEQADADAYLIAAAPDLLEACEMLAEAQRRADAGERDGFGCYVDAVDMARAAIAKAKGAKT